jgi:isopentenyl-diphosphate delta-isomerase
MLEMINDLVAGNEVIKVKQLIVSGGIGSFLDGYEIINKSKLPAIYGQGSAFLKYATQDYKSLKKYIETQIKGLEMAYAYLRVK